MASRDTVSGIINLILRVGGLWLAIAAFRLCTVAVGHPAGALAPELALWSLLHSPFSGQRLWAQLGSSQLWVESGVLTLLSLAGLWWVRGLWTPRFASADGRVWIEKKSQAGLWRRLFADIGWFYAFYLAGSMLFIGAEAPWGDVGFEALSELFNKASGTGFLAAVLGMGLVRPWLRLKLLKVGLLRLPAADQVTPIRVYAGDWNPATGLPMEGGTDIAGNAYGHSRWRDSGDDA